MFNLYYFIEASRPQLVFSGEELNSCLYHISTYGLNPRLCVIISPNKRKITIAENNELIFGNVA